MTTKKLIVSGPEGTRRIPLYPEGATIGRGANCDVMLDDVSVSRLHARIYHDPFGRWIIEDLESHNGVLVDGRHIQAHAVLPGQKFNISHFSLSLSKEPDGQMVSATSPLSTVTIIDDGLEEDIVPYRHDDAAELTPVLIEQLNDLAGDLLKLPSPSRLYAEATTRLAEMLNSLVAIVRLPCSPAPLPKSPDILASCFGKGMTNPAAFRSSSLHLSKRVLNAVRSMDTPVMASSKSGSEQKMMLTIADEHDPHVVFAARVNDLGETVDALYIDMLQERTSDEMFNFVQAVARQINFAQKNLFLIELQKQEKAVREANIKLKEKDRIKDEYVSRVTHDIKGHLAAIQSCLYVTSNDSEGSMSEKQDKFLGRAVNRTLQLTDFVKELLNLTQMRLSGRMDMEAFSLPDSIAKSLASIATKAKEKSITVTSNVDPSLGEIVGNEFSLNEMITNLLFNAVKYTPENKTVHLEAADHDDHVQIDIEYTGIGIPADEVGSIFEEFFRATNARKNEKDGTGLGLSIVKQIVQRHGGNISAQSREGEGTKITVILPKNN